ncbi:Thioesterase/thiol ester dehydrase-isomerase [Aureobasidium sp. EXF-12344]|nr:Thioesterase/thiol ester dehydrase-isomerase [Aureobasidium sp. EXF-12344]
MFYEIGTDHGLPYDPFKACVVPRPIGWISTRSASGTDNLAPYSQFTNLTFDPPYVMFSSNRTPEGKRKDTVVNAEETGFFGWNLATYSLREQVNITAQQLDPIEDEFTHANLQKEDAEKIPVSLVKESPVRHHLVNKPQKQIHLPAERRQKRGPTPQAMAQVAELKKRQLQDYGFHLEYRTRWSDNDMYDHMNNSVYYFLFDSIVNTYLMTHCKLDPPTSPLIGLVVHSHCDYLAPVGFPALIDLGLRVKKLGKSSVTYEIGVFERGVEEVKAVGEFVHVFVDRESRRPRAEGMTPTMKEQLGSLVDSKAKL